MPYQARQQAGPTPMNLTSPSIGSEHQTTTSSLIYRSPTTRVPPESPNFSPFPVLREHPPNVPPTDEQREVTLEGAREEVMASNDPENQLIWAQDALIYVDVAILNEQRVSPRQGIRPHTPTIERRLREDAMNIVRFLAEQHHPRAEFMMGLWLEFGKYGYRVDKKEAFHCYTRSAEKGYPRAEYRIGMQFENSGEPLKAIRYYQQGAEAGDSASHYRLGMMTLLGQHGQQQNFEIGLRHIFTAAQSADENAPQGAYVCGLLQAGQLDQVQVPSQYLPLDIEGARMNIEKAAYLGFAKAQVKMGAAYELSNLGCDFDPVLSLHYNALAARQGEPEAELAISKWFLSGYENFFSKNEELAFIYAERAASNGLETAEFAMGYFNEVGIYVPVDLKIAREWYEKAANKGNKDAKSRIAGLLQSQVLSRNDHEKLALSRIRSQYASYGQIESAPIPPPIPRPATVNMPDPAVLRSQASPYVGQQLNQGYNAPSWSTPAQDQRPTSAFGINPNIRPNTTAPPGRIPPYADGPPRPPMYQRPFGSMSDVRPGPGQGPPSRPPPPPGQMGYPPPGQRPGPRQAPRPGPGMPPPMQRPPPMNRPPGSYSGPPPSVGFVAPPDPSGADRQQRFGPNRPPPASGRGMGPPPPNGRGVGPPPPRTASRPPENPGYVEPPLRTTSASNPRPQQRPQENPQPAPAPITRPPPKGPKTFEEMGVPAQKNGDCVGPNSGHATLIC